MDTVLIRIMRIRKIKRMDLGPLLDDAGERKEKRQPPLPGIN
jgi:hypothetical protein